jgi:hypothetical protein
MRPWVRVAAFAAFWVLGFAAACNWISPQCAGNLDCARPSPPLAFCDPYDHVCFDCPGDGGLVIFDGGLVECGAIADSGPAVDSGATVDSGTSGGDH